MGGFERAAKITGSRFFFLKGDLARLELALQTFAVDFIGQGFHFCATSSNDE